MGNMFAFEYDWDSWQAYFIMNLMIEIWIRTLGMSMTRNKNKSLT